MDDQDVPIKQETEDQENGGDSPKDNAVENGTSEDYPKLVQLGITKKVALELDKIYQSGKLEHSELDERALDALKEFTVADAIAVLKEFMDSNLDHVTNKSAFLCGVMKTYRQRHKIQAPSNKNKGPDQTKLQEILDRTGYPMEVTVGQRKYGGPPPDYDGPAPGVGQEIFCGRLPKDVYEDELIPLFEQWGKIWDLRLMIDPLQNCNRGYCFVTYCDRECAKEAVKKLDNHEIQKGKQLKCNISVANLRLFVGNIPKSKSRDDIKDEFEKKTEGLTDVIVYPSADDTRKKNRGFAFLEFDSHKNASAAKRKLGNGRTKVWGCDILVDWADPMDEPDDETMSKVKVLYVRNLTSDVTDEMLTEAFSAFGPLERVKKVKDYGFVHYADRDDAVAALEALHATKLGKNEIEVSLAKPPSDNKKKEQRKRDQDRRVPMHAQYGYDDYWEMGGRMPPMPPPGRGMRGRPMPPPPPRGYYDPFYDDYYYSEIDYYGGYAPPPRGRGRGPPPPMPRGRGITPHRPRGAIGGQGQRGRGAPRGAMNSRGRAGMRGGRGNMGGARGNDTIQRGKRKFAGEFSQGQAKRRNVYEPAWAGEPIAQQPLRGDTEFYQDEYGGQW